MTTEITRIDKPGASRVYEVDGKKLPSVTSILSIISKPALIPWAAKMAAEKYTELIRAGEVGDFAALLAVYRDDLPAMEKEATAAPRQKMEAAADVGTRVHDYIECLNTGQPLPPVDEEMEPCLSAYDAWVSAHHLKIVQREMMVHTEAYAGTLDALAVNEDLQSVIIDYKTSNGIYDETALQVSAYANAVEYMHPERPRIAEAWVVRFPKDGKTFEAKRVDDWRDKYRYGFQPALALWTMMQNKKGIWV